RGGAAEALTPTPALTGHPDAFDRIKWMIEQAEPHPPPFASSSRCCQRRAVFQPRRRSAQRKARPPPARNDEPPNSCARASLAATKSGHSGYIAKARRWKRSAQARRDRGVF